MRARVLTLLLSVSLLMSACSNTGSGSPITNLETTTTAPSVAPTTTTAPPPPDTTTTSAVEVTPLVIKRLDLGGFPHRLAVSDGIAAATISTGANARSIMNGDPGGYVRMINLSELTIVGDCPVEGTPFGVSAARGGGFWVGDTHLDTVRLLDFDCGWGDPIPVSEDPWDLEVIDGLLYIGSGQLTPLTIVDLQSQTVSEVDLGGFPLRVAEVGSQVWAVHHESPGYFFAAGDSFADPASWVLSEALQGSPLTIDMGVDKVWIGPASSEDAGEGSQPSIWSIDPVTLEAIRLPVGDSETERARYLAAADGLVVVSLTSDGVLEIISEADPSKRISLDLGGGPNASVIVDGKILVVDEVTEEIVVISYSGFPPGE